MAGIAAKQGAMDDGALAARAAGGDRDAFTALIERHYDFIYRIAFRWEGSKTDAEDTAQNVCVRAAKAIRGFRSGSAVTSWLYAITINVARDGARRRKREAVRARAYLAEALIEGAAPADDPAEQLWAAVRRLPDKQREAVTLVYGEGESHARAADLMGCSESTVSWHVHEARKRLKQMMRLAGEEA